MHPIEPVQLRGDLVAIERLGVGARCRRAEQLRIPMRFCTASIIAAGRIWSRHA
jgi:hypothetical protein